MASAPKDTSIALDDPTAASVDIAAAQNASAAARGPEESHTESSYEHTHKWLIAIAVMLGTMLEMLDTSIINVSLPHMQGSFSASVDEITWVLTSYLLANGIMIPMTGWISSRFGRKRYFLTSVVTFVGASAMCGAARSLDQMVLFRLLQGLAGAAMVPSSQAIMMETFPPQEQAMAMATWGLGIMAAPIIGPTLGGWITDNWSWRWNFYINIPVGAIAVLMVSTFVHDPPFLRARRTAKGRVDYWGIAFLIIGLGSMQIVLDRGQRADWFASPWIVGLTALAAISLVALVVRELTFSEPIIDLRILKIPAFTIAVTLVVCMFFVSYGGGVLNPLFLQEYLGYSAMNAGLTMAPRGVAMVVTLLMVGQLARLQHRYTADGFPGIYFERDRSMADGELRPADEHVELCRAQRAPGGWGGDDFPHPVGSHALMRRARAGRLRVEPLQHAAQQLRRGRRRLPVDHAGHPRAGPSELPGGALHRYLTPGGWRDRARSHLLPGGQFGEGARRSATMLYHGIQSQAAMLSFNDLFRTLTIIAVVLIPGPFLLKRAAAGSSPAVGGH